MKNGLARFALVASLLVIATVGLSGCGSTGIKVSESRTNTDLYENAEHFTSLANLVNKRAAEAALLEKAAEDAKKSGQSAPALRPLVRDEAFRILGNCNDKMQPINDARPCQMLSENTPNLHRMDDASIRAFFGTLQFTDDDRAIRMQKFISRLDGWTLPYAFTAKYFSLEAPFNKKECSRGPQLAFVMLFLREHESQPSGSGLMYHQRVVGTAVVNTCTSTILVDPAKAFDAIGAGALFRQFFSK
jgi:hypothetical protein